MVHSDSLQSRLRLQKTALKFLSYRPRFCPEIRKRLTQEARKMKLLKPDNLIDQTINKLKKENLLNDEKLSSDYADYQLTVKGKGPLFISHKLKNFGVHHHLIKKTLQGLSPCRQKKVLTRLLHQKTKANKSLDPQTKAKLIRFFISRGFPLAISLSTIDEMDKIS